jgi:hypothetical protein
MNIVLEGPDNAGKSTLANAISEDIGWPIKPKEGKPDTFEKTVQKIKFYLSLDRLIIDRHPMITQLVYGQVLRDDPQPPIELFERFLYQRPIIIYCRCLKLRLKGHEASPTDTDDHLHLLDAKYDQIVALYDELMIRYASIVYTDWNQLPRVVAMVKGATRER